MRWSATISGFAKYESAIKQGGLVQAASKVTKDDKQFTLRLSTPWTATMTKPQPHHDAIYVVDMEGAQQTDFKFYQTINGCVSCLNTIPKEYIKKVIHIREKADTYARIRGAVAFATSEFRILCRDTDVKLLASGTCSVSAQRTEARAPALNTPD